MSLLISKKPESRSNDRYCCICFEFRLQRYITLVLTAPRRHSARMRPVISIHPRFLLPVVVVSSNTLNDNSFRGCQKANLDSFEYLFEVDPSLWYSRQCIIGNLGQCQFFIEAKFDNFESLDVIC